MTVCISETDPEYIQLIDDHGTVRTLDSETGRIYEGQREAGSSWWVRPIEELSVLLNQVDRIALEETCVPH